MKRKLLWVLIVTVFLTAVSVIVSLRQQCLSQCTASFQGAYPEIACKYECGFFNKFRKPSRRP